MKILVGSRKSDLAQIQARLVADKLKKFKTSIDVDFVFKDAKIDLDLAASLVDSESKGLFTKDLSMDLISEKIDAVVHSWKDLPVLGPKETRVIATLEREDPRDIVFVKKTSLFNKEKLSFLSSSPRREENLGKFIKDYVFPTATLEFVAIRGNIPTRINKFLESEADCLVIALAAVKRLLKHGTFESKESINSLLSSCKSLVVPVSYNPPAPAQGALAIEIKRNRTELAELFLKINHKQSYHDVHAERERLREFGGGCHLKLGIYQRTTERGTLVIERGVSPDGTPLSKTHWMPNKPLPMLPKESIFDASTLNLFDRKETNVERPLGKMFYNISKAEAFPLDFMEEEDVFWVAGLETWKKLREKGFWITGTHESLGEKFLQMPVDLWPEHKLLKLSHKDAPVREGELLATYELVRNQNPIPPLGAYQLFYWPSASLFLECLKADPSIAEKSHACGIGNTYDELINHVPEERLYAVLKREDCLPQT